MGTSPAPLAVSIRPAAVRISNGASGVYRGTSVVTDTGSKPISVRPETLRLVGNHSCKQQGVSWLKIQTAAFQLTPGQSRPVHWTVDVSPGQSGQGAVLAMASVKSSAQFKLGGGVGERVVLGTGQQTCTQPVALPHPSSGAPIGLVVLVAVVAALLVLGLVLVGRRLRRGQS